MSVKDDFLNKSKFFKWVQPDVGTEVFERPNAYVWQGKENIFYAVPKESITQIGATEMDQEIKFWQERKKGNESLKLISVFHSSHVNSQSHRDAAEEIIRQTFSAIAVLNDSALGRMGLKMYLAIKPQKGYELQVFSNVKDAENWLDGLE